MQGNGKRDERREQHHTSIVVRMIIAECNDANEATYLQHRARAIQHREVIPMRTNRTYTQSKQNTYAIYRRNELSQVYLTNYRH